MTQRTLPPVRFLDGLTGGFLRIEFANQDITAFGGLELLRRYLALIELGSKVRTVFARYEVGGDYRAIDMILAILVLMLECADTYCIV